MRYPLSVYYYSYIVSGKESMNELTIEKHLYAYRHLYITLLSAIFFYSVGLAASNRPLWYDELFSYYISIQDNFIAVLSALLNKVDISPPMDYLLRHYAMKLLGRSEFTFRLLSIVTFWLGSICLYSFVCKRTSVIPALIAFCFPLTTLALCYSYEGRPYSLLFAVSCLTLYIWQKAIDNPKNVAVLSSLSVSLALGPYCHWYGVFNYTPIIVGETMRSIEQRKLSLPIVISIFASLAFLPFLYPFALNASGFREHFWTKFSILTPIGFYYRLFSNTVLPIMACILLCSILLFIKRNGNITYTQQNNVPKYEIGAAVTFCLIPFMEYILAYFYTGALTVRYAIVTIVGPTLLIAYISHFIDRRHRICVIAIMLCFTIGSICYLSNLARDYAKPGAFLSESLQKSIEKINVPIVFSGAQAFFETYHYLPNNLKSKIYYLTDRTFAIQYLGFDNDEIVLENMKRILPIGVIDFSEFTKKNPNFIIIVERGGWLMKKLEADFKSHMTELSSYDVADNKHIFSVDLRRH